ncbi:protein far1-related sequence 5-like [Gigaspora margarita]|uniref:Protein far1-related sequence 5-like n=1 Tax=Gigaspora margarita TaxID=4874 RepID=A0A8H3ZYM0_GIGMA|nr:protein far1-related sequence 5-like [Gigaspora margarita]
MQKILASELQKAKYQNYLEGLPYNVRSSASNRVFPKLVEHLRLILTNEIFLIQKAQIDICFEYNSLPIPLEQLSVYDNVDAVDTVVCIEDQLDMRQVALKSLVKGLIQQIEQANNNSSDNLGSSMIQNPFQVDAHSRLNKRIKSSIEVDTSKIS